MIYVITKGAYSDYHICAVATTRENAERLRLMHSDMNDEAQIEEFQEDNFNDVCHTTSAQYWAVWFDKNGKKVMHKQYWDAANLSIEVKDYLSSILVRHISAEDIQHAFKIACDYRAKFLAEKYNI